MCVVSAVGDYWKRDWDTSFPTYKPELNVVDQYAREQIEEIKKSIKEIRDLIEAAKKYDVAMNEPDCQVDEKFELIKKLAKELGVDLKGVI